MPEKVSLFTFPDELSDYQDKYEKLGEGGFAEVHLAEHIPTGIKVAIKVMNKQVLKRMGDLHRAYREIEAMKKLGCHQHICQLYQVVETDEDIYLVLEYVSGGELFDYIVSREKLSEKEARSIFRQIVSAVAYIHDKDLAHRDLKPENMLLDNNNSIKLIDFGLSSNPEAGLVNPLATCCGSPAYAAPELIAGDGYFGSEADVWSLGVVLYGLLNGFLPFDIEDDEPTYLLFEKIKKGEFEIPEWLSEESEELLSQLLQVDPKKRITTEELLNSAWLCKGYGAPIQWRSKLELEKPSMKIVEELSDFYGIEDDIMLETIKKYDYDAITSHYFLLYKLRQKTPRPKVSFKTPSKLALPMVTPSRTCKSVSIDDFDITPTRFDRSKSCADDNGGLPYVDPTEKEVISPLRDTREKASSQVENLNRLISLTPACPKPIFHTKKPGVTLGLATPKFAKKVGKRVANLLTPKRAGLTDEPRKIKAVYKVSTTSTKSARDVREQVETALTQLRKTDTIYSFESSRYNFRVKGQDDRGNKVTFQLEICSVPGLESLVGIRHTRLRGDAWSYKKICDMILGIIHI